MIRTSDTIAALVPALVSCQGAIGGGVAKNKKVEAGQRRYRYADLGAVVEAAAEPMAAAGLAWVSYACEHGIVVRIYHASGEWIEVDTAVGVPDGDPQAVGSALTYGRRYGLMALLGLAAEDDDGQAAREAAPRPKPPAPPPAAPPPKPPASAVPPSAPPWQVKANEAKDAAKRAGVPMSAIVDALGRYGVERIGELDVNAADGFVTDVSAMIRDHVAPLAGSEA